MVGIEPIDLRQLMDDHGKRVFSICLRLCGDYFWAEDLTQETFLAAYNAWDDFDGKNVGGWLTRIASNKCLDYLRSAAVRHNQSEEDGFFAHIPIRSEAGTEAVFFETQCREALRTACEALPENYRSVAIAYYCNDEPLTDYAVRCGLPLSAVQTRAYRAKHMLRNKLKEAIAE
ncbi:MAG: RNA polymerase sigma factor [Oscillospiraceae bacterium]|nr:RNA polymerase sigma factor [Oscillospiraceae bacterium]